MHHGYLVIEFLSFPLKKKLELDPFCTFASKAWSSSCTGPLNNEPSFLHFLKIFSSQILSSSVSLFKGWDECTSVLYLNIWNVKRGILNYNFEIQVSLMG